LSAGTLIEQEKLGLLCTAKNVENVINKAIEMLEKDNLKEENLL